MSARLSGDNGVLPNCESGAVALVVRLRGAGLGFAGPRTEVRALFTTFPMVNLAEADEPRNMSPTDIAASEIIRTARIWVFNLNMGDAPRGLGAE